jgi:uncharacterized membrane protein
MPSLPIAMVLFVGGHVLLSAPPLRRRLVGVLGEKPFLGVYSLIMAGCLVWAVRAYGAAEPTLLWTPAPWTRWLAVAGTWPAFVLLAAALMTPNPTSVGGERLYDSRAGGDGDPAPGVFRITRHPMMWGITLWALLHLLGNGDLPSLIFFGGLAVLSALGPVHIDARRRWADPEGYARLTAEAPFWPWGRGWVSPGAIGWPKLAVGSGLWAVFLGAHGWLFGVSPLAGG